MKIKVDQIRTYDEAGFRRRAACLCFKSECESEVCQPCLWWILLNRQTIDFNWRVVHSYTI